jgi:hypothetical protein
MRHWALAIAALLGGAVGLLHADYVVIKINLATAKDKEDTQENQPGAVPGMPGMLPGGRGMPGGPGMPAMPGMRPGMGPRGPGGFGPGQMPFPGGRGGPGFGGGPAYGSGPGVPGGGRMPNPGLRGGPGMPGGPGSPSALMRGIFSSQAEEDEPDSAPLFVGAVIEVEHKNVKPLMSGRYHIKHKWGETNLYLGDEVEWTIIKVDTVAQKYEYKRKHIRNSDSNRAEEFLDLADWCLAHGLFDKVPGLMDEVAKLDPKQPGVLAYQKVRTALERPISQVDTAIRWREKLGEFKTKNSKHYTLLYDGPGDRQADSVLHLLERNYEGFFSWFALRGKALSLPDHRLVAVLVDNPEAFQKMHKDIFDEAPMIEDGFYERRENLAILSAHRLDEGYDALMKAVKNIWDVTHLSEEELLKGKGLGVAVYYNESAKAQTLTLVRKAMEEEGERAAVTLEGTRQLIDALGLLPRSVEAPQWIDLGMANCFVTPKGSYWSGTGSPNLMYLVNFKLWDHDKKLDKNPTEALKAVVTDRYFHQIKNSKNKANAQAKARTMSWALVYFLAHKKREGLLRYYQELAQEPRDLDLDEDVLLNCFARAFGLVDPKKPDEVDETALNKLAAAWYTFMRDTPLEIDQNLQDALKKRPLSNQMIHSPNFGRPAGNAPAGGGNGSGGGSSN